MTEQEWYTSSNPTAMIEWLVTQAPRGPGDRKLRLFAAAAWRWWKTMAGSEFNVHDVAELAEKLADGVPLPLDHPCNRDPDSAFTPLLPNALDAAQGMAVSGPSLEATCQAGMLRDIVGNPNRPYLCQRCARGPAFLHLSVTGIEYACRYCHKIPGPTHSAILDLARAAYDHLDGNLIDSTRLAILADALEEAGCGDPILLHLRSPKPHVRGCWVVDLILGL